MQYDVCVHDLPNVLITIASYAAEQTNGTLRFHLQVASS